MTSESALIGVVDDEPEIRALLAEMLTREGYRVATCANGDELWAMMEREHPDMLSLDIRMPGEDGLSIARRVRALSNAGIIMVTSLGEVIDRVVGLEMGADDYLAKPFDRRELLARVKSVLRRQRSATPAGPNLLGKIDSLERKLDNVREELGRLNDEALHIDAEASHIETLLHAHREDHCPTCGGKIVYHQAETGSLGICGNCGWSHFVDDVK
jgi:DNA-binding response OmpR family regulator